MPAHEIAAAYDAIAADYDGLIRDDEWIRREVWAHYAEVFRPGQLVLDVSCGTGIDSVFLACRGVRVVASDISAGMLRQLRRKLGREPFAGRVSTCVADSAELAGFRPGAFDGIVSGFAGISTLPDLSRFASGAARLLRPGGRMLLHLLGRFSLWEWLGHLANRRWSDAARLRRNAERSFAVAGHALRHYPHLPCEAYRRYFAPGFALRRSYSLGALRPPTGVRLIPPRVAVGLGWLEARLRSRRPVLDWGRYFVLDLERRDDAGGGGFA
ncbi:MAG: class I SAM-dependent methyltransferase [Acidobacteriia bacterium]|nr:class I SAM-dependent methyltransferase [Terriglobia bacterium]